METTLIGATGYVGAELARLIDRHPEFDLVAAAARSAHGGLDELVPGVRKQLPVLPVERFTSDVLPKVSKESIVFVSLPHGESQKLVPKLMDGGVRVVDLGADYRFRDRERYRNWYGQTHESPEYLPSAVRGLIEWEEVDWRAARLAAIPGCYVTAASLASLPFVRSLGELEQPVIVDALSGVSGAGKTPTGTTHFVTVNESVAAYGYPRHRHRGEMEDILGLDVVFTPHLVPITRGLMATCYLRPKEFVSDPLEILDKAYRNWSLIEVSADPPNTRRVYGTAKALVSAAYDSSSRTIVSVCAIDNLLKGAASQAIQVANLMSGFEDSLGLETLGVWP
jgi:N-acetyl-gamma-glutamyl-phosphate reductase